MSTNLFLTEGGIGGHMSHLYDNRELTFAKLKKIFIAASSGNIEGTEKTDGQNLFISYSAKRGLRGAAKGSRNKGHVKAGGLDPKQLYDFFEGAHPGKQLSKAFSEALTTFERSVKALDRETQIAIFGEDNNIYYNAEVMDKRTKNVIEYDTKSLVIHRAGHGEFDKETGAKTERDVSINIKALDAALPAMQLATDKEEYTVHLNAIRRLEALDDDTALNTALEALSGLQRATGVSNRASITEFMIAGIAPLVDSLFKEGLPDIDVDIGVQKDAVAWILGAGISLNQVKNSFDKEDKGRVSKLLKDNKKIILQRAIAPLENIVHDFSVEMLRGLESAFILDNRKEVERLQQELSASIKKIKSTNDEQEIEVLMRQMEKLKKVENFATASEGFVFDFEGKTYKFTGNFAPANQILGIAKYGRGSEGVAAAVEEDGGKADIAIIPGAFKPPHKGHLAMVAKYAKSANRVIIFMSPLARKIPGGSEMTFDKARQLWTAYLKAARLTNVKVLESPVNSPVGATFNFVANEDNDPEWAQEGETVILGVSTKDGDDARFTDKAQEYAREGVTVLSGKAYSVDPTGPEFADSSGRPLSATGMRQAIADDDVDAFAEYLPDKLKNKARKLLDKISPKKTESMSEMIFRMIHETMDENTAASGAVQGVAGSFGKPNTKDVWRAEKDEDEDEEEEDDMVEEIFKRLFDRPQNKGSKSNAH